jgi:hypothetical protein
MSMCNNNGKLCWTKACVVNNFEATVHVGGVKSPCYIFPNYLDHLFQSNFCLVLTIFPTAYFFGGSTSECLSPVT